MRFQRFHSIYVGCFLQIKFSKILNLFLSPSICFKTCERFFHRVFVSKHVNDSFTEYLFQNMLTILSPSTCFKIRERFFHRVFVSKHVSDSFTEYLFQNTWTIFSPSICFKTCERERFFHRVFVLKHVDNSFTEYLFQNTWAILSPSICFKIRERFFQTLGLAFQSFDYTFEALREKQ